MAGKSTNDNASRKTGDFPATFDDGWNHYYTESNYEWVPSGYLT